MQESRLPISLFMKVEHVKNLFFIASILDLVIEEQGNGREKVYQKSHSSLSQSRFPWSLKCREIYHN
ncbi:CLUMA_CG015987, isoform A [Clunio marinus]|uniref:CLUMA_CG015987, isoform A n=1 Tax=Clunio marinus TaxID=568069 RepID=A0A1J1IS33_9DIPT|nr:CLUMA_CG015987, isoform A [Clunio marinus]